jgi:predicted TIM-barrel fold metal-dependent hydrolase
MIIDADGHLFEPANMWVEHTPSKDRHLALSVVTDALGFPMLHHGGTSTGTMIQMTTPGDFAMLGSMKTAQRENRPNPGMHFDELPLAYWQAAARADAVANWGIDLAVLYPQTGFVWEYLLAGDLESTKVNMAAWNRWAVEVAAEGNGRLQPVGHVTLQGDDTSWLEEQLATLSRGDVKMAMFVPSLVNGKRLSHPDHEAIWQMFVDHNVTPSWHINFQMASIFDNFMGWTDNDTDSFLKVVTGIFQPVSVQMGLADLAANGVFARYPDLRVVLAEVGTHWLTTMLRRLDTIYKIHKTVHGRELTPGLELAPSDYIRRQVLNTCSFPSDADAALLAQEPDNFAFGGDWPHPEGLADPLHDYEVLVGSMDEGVAERFYGNNVARVLALT